MYYHDADEAQTSNEKGGQDNVIDEWVFGTLWEPTTEGLERYDKPKSTHIHGAYATFSWAPFPMTCKAIGVPVPRIGSVLVEQGHEVYGHVFYGEAIQDIKSRRNQPRLSLDRIFIVPPLSAHALCLPCTERNSITMAPLTTPVPPHAYSQTSSQYEIVCYSIGGSRKTTILNSKGLESVVPYAQIIFASMSPCPESKDVPAPPPEVEAAYARMCNIVAEFKGCVSSLVPEHDGLANMYDSPTGSDSAWTSTIVLSAHSDATQPEIAHVLNLILYCIRGLPACTNGTTPVYVALVNMKRDVYAFKQLTGPGGVKTSNDAYAVPPLFNYIDHPLCRQDASRQFSYYNWTAEPTVRNGIIGWQDRVSTVILDDPYDDKDQFVQWFSSNLYNYVNDVSHVSSDLFRRRTDETSYMPPDVMSAKNDLYWALMPDFGDLGVRSAMFAELALTMTRLQIAARNRLDWYARYAFVFQLKTSTFVTHQAPHRDSDVYWTKPGMYGETDAVASVDGVGLHFYNLYGLETMFPMPAEGRYRETSTGFSRDDANGVFLFSIHTTFIRDVDKIWFGYKRTYADADVDHAVPILHIVRSKADSAKCTNNFFYRICNYDSKGLVTPNGTYRLAQDAGALVEAIEPALTTTYQLKPLDEFTPSHSHINGYRYLRNADLQARFHTRRADRTLLTVPFYEINGHFMLARSRDVRTETRGCFVRMSDLSASNAVHTDKVSCVF